MNIILIQWNLVHKLTPYLHKIRFNIIFPHTRRYSKSTFSSGFPAEILHSFLLTLILATCPTRLAVLDL